MRAHAGTIKVYSEVSRGTTVKVLFPATAVASESIDSDQTIAEAWRSSATVLVVDDEGLVRELLKDELEVVGCTVLTAIDGRAGVELFQAHPEIDAVLLDMTMPHMDGPAAFAELREIRSDVAVILMSGYKEQEATSRFAGKGLAGFLKKPFRMELLHKKLREVLD